MVEMVIEINNDKVRDEILHSWPMAESRGKYLVIGSENDWRLANWIKDHVGNYCLVKEEDGLGVLYQTNSVIAGTMAFQHASDGDFFVQSFDEIVSNEIYYFQGLHVAFYTKWWLDLVHNYLQPRVHDGQILNKMQLENEIRTKCEVMLTQGCDVLCRYSH